MSHLVLVITTFFLIVDSQWADPSLLPQNSFLTGAKLPFWSFSGDAYARESYIRLTPDRQSRKGSLWNTEVNSVVT